MQISFILLKRCAQRLHGQRKVTLIPSRLYMPASAFLRKSIVVWSLAAGANCMMGQPTVSPLGGEYAIVEPIPGDQVLPSISLSPSGGVLIWQDNTANGPTR